MPKSGWHRGTGAWESQVAPLPPGVARSEKCKCTFARLLQFCFCRVTPFLAVWRRLLPVGAVLAPLVGAVVCRFASFLAVLRRFLPVGAVSCRLAPFLAGFHRFGANGRFCFRRLPGVPRPQAGRLGGSSSAVPVGEGCIHCPAPKMQCSNTSHV